MRRKQYNDPGHAFIESESQRLFGMTFGALCKRIGSNTNTALARVRRGIPIHVALDSIEIKDNEETR